MKVFYNIVTEAIGIGKYKIYMITEKSTRELVYPGDREYWVEIGEF